MVSSSSLTQDAWFPGDAVIKIENRDTGSITTVTTDITNFSDGGGGKDTESVTHFGGAELVVPQPQDDFNVEFEVTVKDTEWAQLVSDDTTVASGSTGDAIMNKSGGDQDKHKIKLEWTATASTGSLEGYKILYYDARAVEFSKDNSADDRITGTVSFNVAPTNAVGSGTKYEIESPDLADSGIGSSATGSYGKWEQDADDIFGFTSGGML